MTRSCADDPELLNEIRELLDESNRDEELTPIVTLRTSLSGEKKANDLHIGPYRVIKELGSGGMGQVLLAVRADEHFEQFVAVKVLKKGMLSDEAMSRFTEERQILASLNHPNIARLYDGGTTSEGLPWFAMEFVEGLPITKYCDTHQLSVKERIHLFMQVCSAVQNAHQNLIIHRDLKPDNILITQSGTPKLLDFGISKLNAPDQVPFQTLFTKQIMTPEYASPEQIKQEFVSTKSDVYSLGVLLYELLTGQLPYSFKKRTPAEIERVIESVFPKLPSSVSGNKTLTGDLDTILQKALKKDPKERYSTVEQFSGDLKRYMSSMPVTARRDSILYRSGKFIQRHKIGSVVAAGISLLIISFAAISYLQSKEIQRRALEADKQRIRAEQVSTFLTELFELVDPSEAQDNSLSAIALLHRGASRINTELAGQAAVQSNLYLVVSDVYESLGLFKEGLQIAMKADSVNKEIYPETHPEVARALNTMGWLYYKLGDYVTSDSLLNEALAMRVDLFGEQNLDVARSLNDLAVNRQASGNYASTDTLLLKAIEIRKALGDENEAFAVLMSNHAALKFSLGDMDAAEAQMRKALDIFQSVVGSNDMRTANVLSNLGAILTYKGEPDEAIIFYKQAMDSRLMLLGESHPDVALSYAHLGNLYRQNARFMEAEEHLLKAFDLQVNFLGEQHIQTVDSKRLIGILYEECGDSVKAERFYTEAIADFKAILPNGSAELGEVLHRIGKMKLDRKESQEASSYLGESYEIYTSLFGTEHIRSAESGIYYGLSLSQLGNPDTARYLISAGLDHLLTLEQKNPVLIRLAEETLASL